MKSSKKWRAAQRRVIGVFVRRSYGIKSISLFGSYARGEADDESDIDLLIDKGRLKANPVCRDQKRQDR